MRLPEEIIRIKELMFLFEDKLSKDSLFKDFDYSKFKEYPPSSDTSKKTKKELDYLKTIDLEKRFVQEKDDIDGSFLGYLKTKDIDEKILVLNLDRDCAKIVLDLKNYYKRPRPFRNDPTLNDPSLKSTKGFSYPSGHSTQSNLLYLVLSHKYPKLKKDLKKIKDDIVYSRQMAKAHYPSDIKFGEMLAKEMFNYLKNNNLFH